MSTGQTEAEMDPALTCFEALFAPTCARSDFSYLIEMATGCFHQSFPSSLYEEAVSFGRGALLRVSLLLCTISHRPLQAVHSRSLGSLFHLCLIKLSRKIAHLT